MGIFENLNEGLMNVVSATSLGKLSASVTENAADDIERKIQRNKKGDLVKKIAISSNCAACGACAMMTGYIKENPDGTVSPNGAGIVPSDELEAFQQVINTCPVKAISLENTGLVYKIGKEGLLELKQLIQSEFNNYKIHMPESENYKFIKANYHVQTPWGSREMRYEYKSSNKAEDAGLEEFDRIMYSQRRVLIQQILVQYKTSVLAAFTEYIKEAGNYYYDINTTISSRLQEFVAEAQALSNGKLDLSSDFAVCDFEPVFGRPGDKFDREANVYQIKHLEEIWVTDSIMKELEPLSWFRTYVNVDDTEIYDGKREKDMYCYNLREVTSELEKWILNETEYVLNSWDGIKTILEDNISVVLKEVEKGINTKIQTLLQAIDSVIFE
ncbi:MAG: ferredoxin [Clostridia bacterium]